jgi:hypothetical protein
MATKYTFSIALFEIDDPNKYTVNHFEIDIDENKVDPFKNGINNKNGINDAAFILLIDALENEYKKTTQVNVNVKQNVKYQLSMALFTIDKETYKVKTCEIDIEKFDVANELKKYIVGIQGIKDYTNLKKYLEQVMYSMASSKLEAEDEEGVLSIVISPTLSDQESQVDARRYSVKIGGKKPRKSSNSSIKHRIKAHSSRNNIKKRTTRKN